MYKYHYIAQKQRIMLKNIIAKESTFNKSSPITRWPRRRALVVLVGLPTVRFDFFSALCSLMGVKNAPLFFQRGIEDVSILFDHAAHRDSSYLNGHCFVSLMLCVPVWKADKISWLSVPLGYRIWTKQKSKLEPAADMIRQVMSECQKQKNVILLCDSWYMKKPLVSIPEEYPNLDMIGNVRADSVLYDLLPARTGRKDRT